MARVDRAMGIRGHSNFLEEFSTVNFIFDLISHNFHKKTLYYTDTSSFLLQKAHKQSFVLYIIRDQYVLEIIFYGVTSFLEEVKIPLPGPLCHKFWSPPNPVPNERTSPK